MTAPLVVGVDPRRRDPEAALLAALLARATGAPVLAVAAYHPEPHGTRERRGGALARLDAIAPAFYGVQLETMAMAGPSAAQVLRGLAEERGAGLLVVGSTHRGLTGRIAFGHTADRLLQGAPCPVAVAPIDFAERMPGIERVGIAVVDTQEAEEALKVAARLAAVSGASVHAATAAEPIPWSAGGFVQPAERREAQIARVRASTAARLRAAVEQATGVTPARCAVMMCSAATALEQFSRDVDVLVCGSRGHGPLGSVLRGGVARRLIHRAACPVIVVPRGTQRALEPLITTHEVLEAGHA